MPRIKVPEIIDQPELTAIFEAGNKIMGFVPNDGMTMAYRPDILKAFLGLVQAIYAQGEVNDGLKRMVGLIASQAAGCQYCQAHAKYAARRHGEQDEKLSEVWDFQRSSAFSQAEKAALNVAMKASMVPNGVEDEDFEELKKHFNTTQIIEIMAVISMYGFLNRWNATLQTEIEEEVKG